MYTTDTKDELVLNDWFAYKLDGTYCDESIDECILSIKEHYSKGNPLYPYVFLHTVDCDAYEHPNESYTLFKFHVIAYLCKTKEAAVLWKLEND